MTTTLDMSLDDMIKSKRGGNRYRTRERGGGRGPRGSRGGRVSFIGGRMVRRGPPPAAINARPSAHTIAKASSQKQNKKTVDVL